MCNTAYGTSRCWEGTFSWAIVFNKHTHEPPNILKGQTADCLCFNMAENGFKEVSLAAKGTNYRDQETLNLALYLRNVKLIS